MWNELDSGVTSRGKLQGRTYTLLLIKRPLSGIGFMGSSNCLPSDEPYGLKDGSLITSKV